MDVGRTYDNKDPQRFDVMCETEAPQLEDKQSFTKRSQYRKGMELEVEYDRKKCDKAGHFSFYFF